MTVVRVIDFETTGTGPDAEVCEVGVCDVHMPGAVIGLPQSWLCGVTVMPPDARAVHHISAADCAGRPPFDRTVPCAPDTVALVAHNAEFEARFIDTALPILCTYKAALRVWPDAPGHGNGTLRYWLEDQGKITPDHALTMPPHRAGPDAYVTAHIFAALIAEGVTGSTMLAWTRQPPLLPRCPIGKFRGKPWADVETGFLAWMTRQPDMDAGLVWNAQQELDRREGRA